MGVVVAALEPAEDVIAVVVSRAVVTFCAVGERDDDADDDELRKKCENNVPWK